MSDDWKDSVIEEGIDTGIDELVAYLDKNGKSSVREIKTELNEDEDKIRGWADALADEGVVNKHHTLTSGLVLEFDPEDIHEFKEKKEEIKEDLDKQSNSVNSDKEIDGVEPAVQVTLTFTAMAMLMFLNPSDISTYIYLAGIPILFGYTVVISEYGFNKASLASGIGIAFAPMSMFMSAMAIGIFSLNVLISLFASGSSFKDHYSATAVPLLALGLIVGGATAAFATVDSSFETQLEQKTIDIGVDKTVAMMEVTGMNQESNGEAIEDATKSNIQVTEAYVLDSYTENTDEPNLEALRTSFENATQEVPQQVAEQSESQNDANGVAQRTEQMIENMISDRMPLAAFLLAVAILYGLQPIVGAFTAIAASIFVLVGQYGELL